MKKKISLDNFQVKVKLLSHVQLFSIPWTVANQAPQSVEFSRQEYWSGLPLPSPGGLPDPGIEPGSLTPQADSLPSEPPEKSKKDPVRKKRDCGLGDNLMAQRLCDGLNYLY